MTKVEETTQNIHQWPETSWPRASTPPQGLAALGDSAVLALYQRLPHRSKAAIPSDGTTWQPAAHGARGGSLSGWSAACGGTRGLALPRLLPSLPF